MQDNDLEREVKKLIADIIELPEEKISIDARFVEDLGMDSMMALEILASIETGVRSKRDRSNVGIKIFAIKSPPKASIYQG